MNRMSRSANTEGLAVDLKEVGFLNGLSAENRFKTDKLSRRARVFYKN